MSVSVSVYQEFTEEKWTVGRQKKRFKDTVKFFLKEYPTTAMQWPREMN